MAGSLDQTIADIALRQESLWSRAQALEAGASRSLIQRRIDPGRWLRHPHGVLGPPGVPWTHRRRLWAAHLGLGPESLVSHEAAAVTRRVAGYRGRPVVMLRPHSGHAAVADMTVHQIDDCAADHRTTIDGLPITTAARTFVDLAAVSSRARLRHGLEEALSSRLVALEDVADVFLSVCRRGKPGMGLLVTLLDEQTGSAPPESRLERQVLRLLLQAGLPRPTGQSPLPASGGLAGLVDFTYPEARLIVEADGRRWHDRRRNMLLDRDRDNQAAACGYLTMRVMWERATGDPTATGLLVAKTYRDRVALIGAAA